MEAVVPSADVVHGIAPCKAGRSILRCSVVEARAPARREEQRAAVAPTHSPCKPPCCGTAFQWLSPSMVAAPHLRSSRQGSRAQRPSWQRYVPLPFGAFDGVKT